MCPNCGNTHLEDLLTSHLHPLKLKGKLTSRLKLFYNTEEEGTVTSTWLGGVDIELKMMNVFIKESLTMPGKC